jgi:DNA-binding transcriptional regulator YhcF (GntR family)
MGARAGRSVAGATSRDLEIAVDRAAEVPLGVQLAWALRCRIRDGALPAGERLPGLRELAEAARVNVNTVRAVYQRLEHEGLIETVQGSGTFVASTPRSSVAGAIAADAEREARATGVDPREVAAALYVASARTAAGGATESDGDAARRRALRDQIAALERTLGELVAAYPSVCRSLARPPRRPSAEAGPALLGVVELEGVRTELVRRLSAAQAAIDALGEPRRTAPERGSRARATPEEGSRSRELTPASEAATPGKRGRRTRRAKANPAPAGA